MDRQFYVNHEGDYQSHELQAFTCDLGDSVTVTSGIFFYDAEINQRGDFYSEANDPRFLYADPSQAAVGAGTMVNLFPARDLSAPDGVTQVRTGAWEGDPGGTSIEKGPDTAATDLMYHTTTKRDALFAAYTQGV